MDGSWQADDLAIRATLIFSALWVLSDQGVRSGSKHLPFTRDDPFPLLWGQLQSTNDEDCRKTNQQSVAGDAQRPFADLKNLASRG